MLAQQASEAGRQRTTSLAVYLEMIDTEVGHVMATNRVLAWAKRCWNNKNEEGMHRVEVYKGNEHQLDKCRRPGSSVRLQLEDIGLKWSRYDTSRRVILEILGRTCTRTVSSRRADGQNLRK